MLQNVLNDKQNNMILDEEQIKEMNFEQHVELLNYDTDKLIEILENHL